MADLVLQSPKNPHFFQPLLPGFHTHLSIPFEFFSKYIEGRNKKNMVELTSNASEKTWKVKMEGRKLTVGWKYFAEAHDFRIGDIIVFRHEGDLLFHVTGLGPSCCEIQYVQPSNNHDDEDVEELEDITDLRRKKHEKKRVHEGETKSFESDQSCFVARVTDSNLQKDTLFLPRKLVRSDGLKKGSNKIVLMDERGRTWTLNLRYANSSGTFFMSVGWRTFCLENKLKPGDSITFKLERNNKKTPLLRFSKKPKCVTKHSSKDKKRKTGESSQSIVSLPLNENRFMTLHVTPSSLRNSRLCLPVSFTRLHKMENAGGKITLVDNKGVEWPVNIFMYMNNGKKNWRMGLGLTRFLKAIHVKENESLVFEFVREDTTSPPILKLLS